MAITLPLPLRVAAGIVATGIHVVRSLPEELPAIPVTIVGNAMRLSMRVQQEITTLATRGDELLGGLLGGRAQESPAWATFDEDKEPPAAASTPSSKATRKPSGTTAPSTPQPSTQDVFTPGVAGNGATILRTPETTALPDADSTATEAAVEVTEAVVEAATRAVADTTDHSADDSGPGVLPDSVDEARANDGDVSTATSPATPDAVDDTAGPDTPEPAEDRPTEDDGPAVLPGYDLMTLAQVRGHLRELTAQDVSALLAYEQAGDNRAPFLTLLSNRLVTLDAQNS